VEQINIYIPLKPVSVNNLRQVVRGRLINTREANSFKKHCKIYLREYHREIKTFSIFKKTDLAFSSKLIFWIPRKKLITKINQISKTSGDIDNNSKCVIDEFFYYASTFNKNLNDSQIVKMSLEKRVAKSDVFGFTLHLSHVDISL